MFFGYGEFHLCMRPITMLVQNFEMVICDLFTRVKEKVKAIWGTTVYSERNVDIRIPIGDTFHGAIMQIDVSGSELLPAAM